MRQRRPLWRRVADGMIEGCLGLAATWLPQRRSGSPVRIRHERLHLSHALGRARRLRLAFASDLHAGPLTPAGTIEAACQQLMALQPDLILLGGDYVCSHAEQIGLIGPALRQLRAPLGVFGVLGNHDHEAGAAAIATALERCGVQLLVNQGVRLPTPFERTLLLGLDDHLAGRPQADRLPWDDDLATLLLLHQPSGLLDVGSGRFDLAVAGHTHGGQITLPGGYAPIVSGGALSRRYLRGRFPLAGGGQLLVSVGVGNTLLPLRIGPQPEVLLCDVIGRERAD